MNMANEVERKTIPLFAYDRNIKTVLTMKEIN